MHSPASPLYRGDHFHLPTSPIHRKPQHSVSNKIDYTKFKTKMCRNYAMGLPCPFESRCAFSHGENDVEPMTKVPHRVNVATEEDVEDTSSSTGSLASPKARLTSGSLYSHAVTAESRRLRHSTTDVFSSNSSEGASFSSFHRTSASTAAAPGQNANATEFLPPPPPSYETALSSMAYEPVGAMAAYGVSAKDALAIPPAYPTRFRHDPYSFAGVVYE